MAATPDTIFIAGPTGSGKSDVALELAAMIDAEIVSADAYQVYQGMPILTATPSSFEIHGVHVPHHMIGIIPPSRSWNASDHYHMASGIIRGIHSRGKKAVVVGGSGLYFKFLTHGISQAPPSDEQLRQSFAGKTLDELVGEFTRLDPEGAAHTNLGNRRYVERNLEIVILGGQPLSYWKSNWQRDPNGPCWVLEWDVDKLDRRIAARAALMLESGVAEEVMNLGACSPTAEKTLGLDIVRSYISGLIDKDECVRQLALATRQYAKRQRTWLKREKWMHKLDVQEFSSSYDLASQVKEALTFPQN